MDTTRKYLGTIYNDWYFLTLLLLIAFFSVYTYIEVIPLDIGLASLIVLVTTLFFSLEDLMPNSRKVRERKKMMRSIHNL